MLHVFMCHGDIRSPAVAGIAESWRQINQLRGQGHRIQTGDCYEKLLGSRYRTFRIRQKFYLD